MISALFLATLLLRASACPEHALNTRALHARAEGTSWSYESTYNWGSLNTTYARCQTGSNQSPIPLSLTAGLSSKHLPTFGENYASVPGALYNWGYGPAFSLDTTTNNNITAAPTLSYDNQTLFLKGWHIHAPADHSVQGAYTKAELHLVHADSTGKERAVVALRIDPGNRASAFFGQFVTNTNSSIPGFNSTQRNPQTLNIMRAIQEVSMYSDFWTYMGSLTSPPCTEGIRWFVSRTVLYVSHEQMQQVLAASTFSARVEQQVWRHGINE